MLFLFLFSYFHSKESVLAFSPVDSSKSIFTQEGIVVYSGERVSLLALGSNLTSKKIWFTEHNRTVQSECTDFSVHSSPEAGLCFSSENCIAFSVDTFRPETTYFGCLCDNLTHKCTHLGSSPMLTILVRQHAPAVFPLWLKIMIVVIGFFFTGLFSGLNLGLMSLGLTELQIIEDSGTPTERKYAQAIKPIRKRGNLLLCTILFGNVLVNTTITILLDDIVGSGAIAVVASTLGIVILGEIIPQAVCSRHSLKVGAKTIWITIFFIFVTFPLSFPISFILTKCLGEEIGQTFSREKLIALIRITVQKNDPKRSDAMNIIAGALEMCKKNVKDVMTLIDDVFMLNYDSILNFETMSGIMQKGFTRIPIYQDTKSNIVAILNVKDLTFVGPDDSIPLRTICNFYRRTIMSVLEQISLETMLKDFLTGRSHMAIVRREVGVGEYEVTGLITLEDIIEEILQAEIVDETDSISCVAVDIFGPKFISDSVLRRLLKQSPVVNLNVISSPDMYTDPDSRFIYRFNEAADYFVLLLQGRCIVCVGKEKLFFDAGAFTYFGIKAIKSLISCLRIGERISVCKRRRPTVDMFPIPLRESFISDFSLQAMTDVQYIKITAADYTNACRATALEMQNTCDAPLLEYIEDSNLTS
ncbi:metal transporter CNNM4-like [Octopus sinensis]|uniref:Metal transporter CNNM4-like n=1 Tax=Octopus sinensis TaxID=2607531 RepID=A0A6P7U350_9MOLL|nr:metal transporter CNNM4-like [Octopus sinensis]